MKTLDRLDHEEARQALALFSQMEAAAKGRDVDAILAASTNMVAESFGSNQGQCSSTRFRRSSAARLFLIGGVP
jgi:hypothetical protein